jgi:hypothetical protein
LLGKNPFVVCEELEVEVLHGLDVPEDDGPVVVEMRLQLGSVAKVHNNYIISA